MDEPFVVVVAIDGENDAPFNLSAKLPATKGYFVNVIQGPGGGGIEPFHNDIERVGKVVVFCSLFCVYYVFVQKESFQERKRAELMKPKYQVISFVWIEFSRLRSLFFLKRHNYTWTILESQDMPGKGCNQRNCVCCFI
jgi:hypothetical protein